MKVIERENQPNFTLSPPYHPHIGKRLTYARLLPPFVMCAFNPKVHRGPITASEIEAIEQIQGVGEINVIESRGFKDHVVIEVFYNLSPTWDVQQRVLKYMIQKRYTAVSHRTNDAVCRYEFKFWGEVED